MIAIILFETNFLSAGEALFITMVWIFILLNKNIFHNQNRFANHVTETIKLI